MGSFEAHIISDYQIELIKDKCNRINGMISILEHESFVAEIKSLLKDISDTVEFVRKEGKYGMYNQKEKQEGSMVH